MSERRTRQLDAVYDVVCASHDHPTAEEVCARVRRKLPRVSLGTVYRNLQKLAACQQVRIVQLADRSARYDSVVEEHDHFVCERCGAVTDLLRQPRTRPACATLSRSGYAVRAHALTYYGLCPTCAGGRAQKH